MPRDLQELRSTEFDVLVIGGGITGAGVALDATLRGLKVALVEKNDFASGTSSASSKLIHGGLRYLEYREFALVREALRERHTLLRIAPHLVWPLRIILPDYAGRKRSRWMIKLGMWLYDYLAGAERIGRHRWLSAEEIQSIAPGLRGAGLRGGFEFFDAQMDDARLCLEVVLSAVAQGAVAANYVEAVEFPHDRSGHISGCEAIDQVTGQAFRIRARKVVNAAGPWVDQVCRIDNGTEPSHIAPTKGVHLVLPDAQLGAGLLVTHPHDHRVMFVLPWMRRTLVGTTDTFFDQPPDAASVDASDVDYLLAAANFYFENRWSTRDVLGSMVGLRPLQRTTDTRASAVTREFSITRSASGLWSIFGGKYTTYRSMAQSLVDRVVTDLGKSIHSAPCRTATHHLIGTPREPWLAFRERERRELAAQYRLDEELVAHLIQRYGTRARQLVGDCATMPSAWERIVPTDPDVLAEVRFQSEHELARHRSDHLLRRTRLGLFHPQLLASSLDWPHFPSIPPHRDYRS